jgi:hypothetical protein
VRGRFPLASCPQSYDVALAGALIPNLSDVMRLAFYSSGGEFHDGKEQPWIGSKNSLPKSVRNMVV